MENNNVGPEILSDRVFDENTYTVVHSQSSLILNDIEKESVENNWKTFIQEAQLKGSQPWDGTFYRMENIQDIISGSKELTFSTIKYSQVRGLKHNANLSTKLQPNNIGTASLIRTTDGYFIFGVRNSNSTSKSRIDLIGGGLQESEFVVNNFSDVFKNELKEIQEEIGLSKKDITSIEGIGILLSGYSNILFIFLTQLNLSKYQVQNIFSKNEDDEMIELDFVEEKLLEEYLKDKGDYRPLTSELYSRNFKRKINT